MDGAPEAEPAHGWWDVVPLPPPRGRRSVHELRVEVRGAPVTVTSATHPLDDVPEAWATAFAVPAARFGVGLRLPVPVDPAWRAGMAANVGVAAGWWGGSATVPLRAAPPAPGRRRRPVRPARRDRTGFLGRDRPVPGPTGGAPAPGVARCFTGGADSFFSLLHGDHRPTHLLYVAGFDVDVDDQDRIARVTRLVEEVAAERGLEPLVVSCDLRRHPLFAEIPWDQTHGAAIAAVAHLLHRTVGTVVIPPSYAQDRLIPWGSRPDVDARWSVPDRLRVVHGDNSGRRIDRVVAIAGDPLVQRTLRVCWRNVGDDLNCGRCEKCVRTMVMLAGARQLERCVTFPTRHDLPGALASMEPLSPGLAPMWLDLLEGRLHDPERQAVVELLARSGFVAR